MVIIMLIIMVLVILDHKVNFSIIMVLQQLMVFMIIFIILHFSFINFLQHMENLHCILNHCQKELCFDLRQKVLIKAIYHFHKIIISVMKILQ